MAQHIVRAFSDELDALETDIARMGGLVEAMTLDAAAAILRRDADLAREVAERDPEVDRLEAEIERRTLRLLALRQPMAADLRQAVAGLKVIGNLERVGDLAKNIARRAVAIGELHNMNALRGLERMSGRVAGQLKRANDAYIARDVEGALRVWRSDDEIDAHYDSLFRDTVEQMARDGAAIEAGAHLLFVAKNLERIGDHATNIAEAAYYLATGEAMPGDRPKSDS